MQIFLMDRCLMGNQMAKIVMNAGSARESNSVEMALLRRFTSDVSCGMYIPRA